jgi:hypothetical protein
MPARPASRRPSAWPSLGVLEGREGLEAALTALPLLLAMTIFDASEWRDNNLSDAEFFRCLTKERVAQLVSQSQSVSTGVWAAIQTHLRALDDRSVAANDTQTET